MAGMLSRRTANRDSLGAVGCVEDLAWSDVDGDAQTDPKQVIGILTPQAETEGRQEFCESLCSRRLRSLQLS